MLYRVTLSDSHHVISSQSLRRISVSNLKTNCNTSTVDILCVINDTFFVSDSGCRLLFFYSLDGIYLSSLTIDDNDVLYDAISTFRGDIVYTTSVKSNKVVLMSMTGRVITHRRMSDPRRLSMSNDNVIYLADYNVGVYQSTDDGVTWTEVFKSIFGWNCWQAIKVKQNNIDEFWTPEYNGKTRRMCVYTVDKRRPGNDTVWREINLPIVDGRYIDLSYGSLVFDGKSTVFLSTANNKSVYLFSVSGDYLYQLLSQHNFKRAPRKLTLDTQNQLLYVGQRESVIDVFKLRYREKTN